MRSPPTLPPPQNLKRAPVPLHWSFVIAKDNLYYVAFPFQTSSVGQWLGESFYDGRS